MSYLIIGLIFLAVMHFIYESIVAPSLRLRVRFELFSLRDELRALKVEHGDRLDDKHFNYLQDSINSIIFILPRIEIFTLAHIRQSVGKDARLNARLTERQKILDDCDIPEMGNIRKRSIDLSIDALGINSGMWVVYILPPMALGAIRKSIARWIKAFISLSEPDLQKIAPNHNSNSVFFS
jgi:hypothetical protein